MNKNNIKLLIVHLCVLTILFYGLFLLIHNKEEVNLEKQIIRNRADQVETTLQVYLEPIIRGAQILAGNDFLRDWLKDEEDRASLDEYLHLQSKLIGCEAIDLASARTERVYQDAGTIVTMDSGNERDFWYYDFMSSGQDHSTEFFYNSLEGILYIYHNLKLYDSDDSVAGVIGLLIRYDEISEILNSYQEEGMDVYFIDSRGEIIIHPDQNRIGNVAIYDYYGLLQKGHTESGNSATHVESMDENLFRYVSNFENLDSSLVIEQELPSVWRGIHGTHIYLPVIFLTILIMNGLLYLFLEGGAIRPRRGKRG